MKKSYSDLAGKHCLVTGGMGFVGSHLCAKLSEIGAKVMIVDIESDIQGTMFNINNRDRSVQRLSVDLSQTVSLPIIENLGAEIIFHLAGSPYAPYTSAHPLSAYLANVVTTANMLEVARKTSANKFILASSACVFGATTQSPLSTNGTRSKGEHYYTYTKRQAEEQVEAYREFYDLPAIICRFVNIYGPGDRHFGRLVPSLCQQLLSGKVTDLQLRRSNGYSLFEFLHVDDAVTALLTAACQKSTNQPPLHFGPGPSGRASVRQVAEMLSLLYDNKKRNLRTIDIGGEQTVFKFLDITDTQKSISWKAAWKLQEGLSNTLIWYSENLSRLKAFANG